MKVIIAVAVFVLTAYIEGDAYHTFKRGLLECVEEAGVSPHLVLQVASGNWNVKDDSRLKVWALCLLVKTKVMSREGVFHLDEALSAIPEQDREDVEKKIDECLFTRIQQPEETAWHFLRCYHTNHPKYYFI